MAGIVVSPEEQRAIDILGINKVTLAAEVAVDWNIGLPEAPSVRFSEETLHQHAQQNEAGTADWQLIYNIGFSLREQRERRGTDRNRQPCFFDNQWWLNESEYSWATQHKETGYRLLNFKLQFTNMNWLEQTDTVAELGNEYERASERDVSEAIFSISMAAGERFLEHSYHWGYSLSSGGGRVLVGGLDSSGLLVSYDLDSSPHPRRGVIVACKPDF